MTLALALLGTSALAQSVSVTGACPGVVDIDIDGFTPNGGFAMLTGAIGGNDVVPAGPCAGTQTGLSGLSPRVINTLDQFGDAQLSPNLPGAACTDAFQILDVTTCQLSPAQALGNACQLPNNALAVQGPANVQMPTPVYYGVRASGIVENGVFEDYSLDTTYGAFAESARIEFVFMDVAFVEQCTVSFDLSIANVDPAFTSTNGVQFDAVDVNMVGGLSTCGLVDPGVFGTNDLRVWLAQVDWSLGVGPLGAAMSADLQAAVVASGLDWNNDWAPNVFSVSVGETGTNYGVELSYGFQYDRTCETVPLDANNFFEPPLPAPFNSLSEFVNAGTFYVFVI